MAYDRRRGEAEEGVHAARRHDFWLDIGRVFLPAVPGRAFVILDDSRARTLRAWVDVLIPAQRQRPAASAVAAAEYIDATALHAARMRGPLIGMLDALERLSQERLGTEFASLNQADQTRVLQAIEEADAVGMFGVVRDLAYEAYYTHPDVLDVLERETGWRYEAAFSGSEMEQFDERLLTRMRSTPARWREA
jgi:hypothetical protein